MVMVNPENLERIVEIILERIRIAQQDSPTTIKSTPRSGERRIYDLRLNADGNFTYDFEDIPEP